MGDWNFDDDDFGNDTAQGDGPPALRKYVKSLEAAKKKLEQENASLRETTSELQGTVRSRSVADVLQAKGVSPKVAKFIPADVEPDEASVSRWLAENKDVFNIQVSDTGQADTSDAGSQSQGAPAPQQASGGFDPEMIKALQAVLGVGDSGGQVIPANAPDGLEAILGSATSQEELLAGMAQFGITTRSDYNS
jgi:hypothetical protein